MKKIVDIIAIIAVVIVAGFCGYHIFFRNFQLSPEYYNSASMTSISANQLRDMRTERKSFILLVARPDCRTADDLRKNIQDMTTQYNITMFETTPTELENSNITDEVKFFPSVLVFHDGRLVDYLDANDDNDVSAYTTRDGLENWLKSTRVELAR